MNFSKIYKLDTTSRRSTEEDSASDKDQQCFYIKTNPQKHKTQLCKTYSELGYCPYQHKCRFAHGKHQLIRPSLKVQSKSRKCNGFWKNGCCPYGSRCQFGHAQRSWEDRAILLGLQATCGNENVLYSKLLKIIH